MMLFKNLVQEKGKLNPAMQSKLETLTVSPDLIDDNLMHLRISEEDFVLLAERDILPSDEAGGDPLDEQKKRIIRDVKHQLRTILSNMSLSRNWKTMNLVEILRAESQTLTVLELREPVAQIGEVNRLLRLLPDSYKHSNFAALYDEILQEFKKRAPYITYLVKVRQDLSITYEFLQRHRDMVLRTKNLYVQYYKTAQIHNFIEKRENEIVKFVEQFASTELLDEKANLVKQFLQQSMEALSLDPVWKNASPEGKTEANLLMEKDFMCRIYQNAFYPNGDLDKERDTLFDSHIVEICKFITMDHEAIQINPKYRSQAPWTLAQKELMKINVYKAPGDKLNCIVQACKTIMNLITFNGKEVGADDFFPVLVFVVLQANPRNLLSNVQYIRYFYESKATGEASYWWSQFLVAVEFIKTLNPKKE